MTNSRTGQHSETKEIQKVGRGEDIHERRREGRGEKEREGMVIGEKRKE